jgi:hypothetical protein
MHRRIVAVLLALALVPLGTVGCQRTVSVQTGERVTCRYGDVIKDTVRTIKVPASKAAQYSVKTSFSLCERHERLLSLYMKAQDQIRANKLSVAKGLLAQVVAGDPKFEQAATQLAAINAGKKPAPDLSVRPDGTGGSSGGSSSGGTGSTNATQPPSGGTPVGPTLTLAAWAPATLAGYATGVTAADPLALSREYLPKPASDSLEALVISVEQFSSGKRASEALKQQMTHYDKGVRTGKVAGRTSTFGTDGKQFAALMFVDRAMLIILEGHAKKGVQPSALHDEIVRVAGKLPVK